MLRANIVGHTDRVIICLCDEISVFEASAVKKTSMGNENDVTST